MAYGLGLGVGGAAAQGIASGFDLGLRSDAAEDRRQQLARENARQDVLDAQRADQLARNNKRQDVADADTQQDRGIAAVSAEMEDNRYQLAALAQQYGGADKIPQSVVNPLIAQANDIVQRRTTLLNQKYAPVVQAEQQWAQNMASRWQAGQIQPQDFKPGEFTRMVQALTGRSVNDFVRPTDPKTGAITGNSVVGQGIADVQAGLPSGNGGLVAQGTNALLGNEVQQGVGQVAPDGSIVTGKTISALVPAPAPLTTPPAAPVAPLTGLSAGLSAATAPAQSFPVSPTGPPTAGGLSGAQADASTPPGNGMGGAPDTPAAATPGQPQPAAAPPPTPMQALTAPSLQPPAPPPPPPPPPPPLAPGTDPNRVIPVLQVTAQHPDGTTVQYHAPMTQNRSTDPNDPLHPGFQISDAMQRMGQLGTLEAFINTPGAQQMIASDKAALGPGVNDFPSAYAAMHGDPKALLPVGSTDPTTQKIAAINKFMNDYNADPKNAGAPITFAQAVQQVEGKPMGPTTGIAAQLGQIHDQAVKDGLSDEAEAKKLQGLGVLRTPPAGPQGTKPPSGYEPDPANPGQLKYIKGGPADPDVKGGAAVLGAREAVFINRTLTSANEAAKDLENVVNLPISASTGIFGGRKQGPGLLDAGKEALTNTLTPQEVQSYNVRSAGFHRALAGIESAGLAPSGQLSNQMDSVIIKSGDSYMTKLEKLAQTRQIVEAGLETTLANPKLPKQQADLANTVIQRIRTAVPFTMKDVDSLQGLQETNPNATMADVIKANGLGGGGSPPVVNSDADYAALPPGTAFVDAQGKPWTKPGGTAKPAAGAAAIPKQ